jgi:hypothetical protein
LEPTEYALAVNQDISNRRYSYVISLRTSDVEEVIDAFVSDREEFADHLKSQFPDVDVTLVMKGDDWDTEISVVDDDEEDEFTEYCGVDDEDTSVTDSAERQYAEEGLTIVDEDDEDDPFIMPELDDDSCPEDEEEDEYAGGKYDESFDPYTPSADDMEDLWAAFGQGDRDD